MSASHSDAADGSNRPCPYLLPGADVVVQYIMACLQLLLLDLNLLLLEKKSWSPRLLSDSNALTRTARLTKAAALDNAVI